MRFVRQWLALAHDFVPWLNFEVDDGVQVGCWSVVENLNWPADTLQQL